MKPQNLFALLDGGQSMLEKALIADGMDRVRLHIVLVFMVVFVDFFLSIFDAFCSVSQIGSILVANQASHNKTPSWRVNTRPPAFATFFF